MFGLVFVLSIVCSTIQAYREACEKEIPAENWANKGLINKDMTMNISEKEFSRNLANGKYKLTETHPEPHRNANGKIIIENSLLYKEDLKKYGACQTMRWVRQGKYNLTPEELKKEKERIKKEFKHSYSLL